MRRDAQAFFTSPPPPLRSDVLFPFSTDYLKDHFPTGCCPPIFEQPLFLEAMFHGEDRVPGAMWGRFLFEKPLHMI